MEPVGISLTTLVDLGGVQSKHTLESIYIQVIITLVLSMRKIRDFMGNGYQTS